MSSTASGTASVKVTMKTVTVKKVTINFKEEEEKARKAVKQIILTSAKEDTEHDASSTLSEDSRLCQECDSQPATVYCIACAADFCSKCDPATHSTNVLKTHTRIPVEAKPKTWTVHPRKGLETYCTLCNQLICHLCTIYGPHKDHPTESVSDAAKRERANFENSVAAAKTELTSLTDLSASLTECVAQTQQNGAALEARIEKEFAALYQLLEQRKASLLNEVRRDVEKRVEELMQRNQRVKESMDALHVLCNEVTVNSSDMWLLEIVSRIAQNRQHAQEYQVNDLNRQSVIELNFEALEHEINAFGRLFSSEEEKQKALEEAQKMRICFHCKQPLAH